MRFNERLLAVIIEILDVFYLTYTTVDDELLKVFGPERQRLQNVLSGAVDDGLGIFRKALGLQIVPGDDVSEASLSRDDPNFVTFQ